MELTIKAPNGIPVLGAPSHRSASRKLIRSMPRCWRMADWHMTIRIRLETMAKPVRSFSTALDRFTVQHIHLHHGLEIRQRGFDLPALAVELGEVGATGVWHVRDSMPPQ